ncbi:MAG: hypothetical protein AAGE03_02745 [Pseudomonadota bacterium]
MMPDRITRLLRLRAVRRDAAQAAHNRAVRALEETEARLAAAEIRLQAAKTAHDHLARNGYVGLVGRVISGPALAHVGHRIDLLAQTRNTASAAHDEQRRQVAANRAALDAAKARLVETCQRHDAWHERLTALERNRAVRREDAREDMHVEDRVGRMGTWT